jgi:hypothetical protein
VLRLVKAASRAATNTSAALHEVATFNFRHSIGPSLGLRTHCEHEQLFAVVRPLGIERHFQRANIIALHLSV